jgi:ribosomal protein S18 acetylase RimI-like enzyme
MRASVALLDIARARPEDALGIVRVLEAVVAERIYSAIDKAWTVEQQASYVASLSPREALHVARDPADGIIGFQSLDQWSTLLPSMAHVGQVGTFLLPGWRGLGVGRTLWNATEAFANRAGYEKLAIQVRASNVGAQRFYRALGFKECGRLTRQVRIDGVADDEVLMELFLRC